MDLKTVISDSSRISKIPTVITDEVFTVKFFNNAAKKLIPGLSIGHGFDEYVTIYDKSELKRSKYPCYMLIGCGEMKYPGVFCPVSSGFSKEYVFSIPVPDKTGYDDCEQYLTMKLAVISKCLGDAPAGTVAGKERAFNKIRSAYEANVHMLAVMSGDDGFRAVNIKQLLSEAFDYYGTVKYGSDRTKRFEIETNNEYVKIKKALCIILVCVYDLCQALSRNGFCGISVNSRKYEGDVSFVFTLRPKHKLASLINASGDTDEAVYMLLGRGAENMLLIKTLVRHLRGQAVIDYDMAADELRFCIAVPVDGKDTVKAGESQLSNIARAAVQMCCVTGKA